MSKSSDNTKGSSKIGLIIISILIVAIIGFVVGIIIILCNPKEGYRFVDIEKFEGKVKVSRGDDSPEVFEGLRLHPSDKVTTKEESSVELLVDDDKHIWAEENTVFTIEATGDEGEGRVSIKLKSGKALVEIENKLNEDSEFEIKTSNATLSVRGTIYSVEYDPDRNVTIVSVMKGLVYADTNTENFEINPGETYEIGDDYISRLDIEEAQEDSEDNNDDSNGEDELAADEDIEEEPAEEDLAYAGPTGYIEVEQLNEILAGQINEQQLTYIMDCILTGIADRRDPVEMFGYNMAHSTFTDGKNANGDILTLLEKQNVSGEIDFYYDINEVESLASMMGSGTTIAESFPNNVSDGRFKAVRYTTVQEDASKTKTKLNYIYVDEEGTIYVEATMEMSFYSDPDVYKYTGVTKMQMTEDGIYKTVEVTEGKLADLGL